MAFIPESMFRNHVVDDHHHHNLYPAAGAAVPEFMMRRSMSFSGMDRGGPGEEFNPDEDGSDDGSSQLMLGEKKRRLNLEQVKALEKSFDSGNKLEPERKMQLARALGLQPRQIAIWFQNRRARWKTKQLEKDYDALRRQFEALKADNEALKSQNKSLRSQLVSMKSSDHHHRPINLNKDNEGSNWSNGSENSCEVNLNTNDHVVFPSPPPATTLTHFIHESTKINNNNNNNNINGSNSQTPPVSNEHCFGNVMFGGIEENPEFWPWPEQQNFQ